DAVRLGQQRLAVDSARAADVDVHAADLLLAAGLDAHLGLLLAARAFLARALQLRAQLVDLARPRMQERVRLARGDCLDSSHAGAERALRQERDGPDRGGRAHMRPPAELARVSVDLDEPHLV